QQEQGHLERVDAWLAEREVRPTLRQPLWSGAGRALGVATALAGPATAMACTEAVEDEIDEHYSRQIAALGNDEPELGARLAQFRADEREHRDAALAAGASDSVLHPITYSVIRAGCRMAIALTKRI
ncbi:MAG: demethoxyubiquinone hydroxylase family protein, partial [Sphingosinicella sp.]